MRAYFSTILLRATRYGLAASIWLLVTACSTLQYDSSADSAITKLQTTIHLRISNWISGAVSQTYTSPENLKFYDQAETDLKALELRMESIPDPSTEKLPIIFSNIMQILESMRNVHKSLSKMSATYLR